MLSIFCAPSRYVQGRDATAALGDEMKKLGLVGPVLIIASGSARKYLFKSWMKTFERADLAHHLYDLAENVLAKKLNQRKERQSQLAQK